MAVLSLMLAVFNLLPIPPLDGSKVLKWNLPIYIIVMALAVFLFLVSWQVIAL
jgi:Zn-dependent protease